MLLLLTKKIHKIATKNYMKQSTAF